MAYAKLMTNAKKFKVTFGLDFTEISQMSDSDRTEWLNEKELAVPKIIYCENCQFCDERSAFFGDMQFLWCTENDKMTEANGFCHKAKEKQESK